MAYLDNYARKTKMAIAGVMGEGENRSEEEVRKVYLKGALFFKQKKIFGALFMFLFFQSQYRCKH